MKTELINVDLANGIIKQLSAEYFLDGFSLVGTKKVSGDTYLVFEKQHPVWDIIKPTTGTYTVENASDIESIYNWIKGVYEKENEFFINLLLSNINTYPNETFEILKYFANK